jgi:hypothetical protein
MTERSNKLLIQARYREKNREKLRLREQQRRHDPSYTPMVAGSWAKKDRICSVDGCNGKHHAQGLCSKHYKLLPSQREQATKTASIWRGLNRHKDRLASMKYRSLHPDRVRATEATIRAKRRLAEGQYSADEIHDLYLKQRGRCVVCHTTLTAGFHRDHILPLALGGSNWIKNIQLLCRTCNCSKHAKDPISFMQSKGYLL